MVSSTMMSHFCVRCFFKKTVMPKINEENKENPPQAHKGPTLLWILWRRFYIFMHKIELAAQRILNIMH